MKKRGQFFLIAALIIIVIVFSLISVYNSISFQKSDLPYANTLAKDIKEESAHIIDNGYFNSLTNVQIQSNLDNLSLLYSKSNPFFNITIISSNPDFNSAKTFSNGSFTDVSSSLSLGNLNNNITLSLNNMNNTFNLTKGYNLFVVIQKENDVEKYIAKA